MIVQVPENTSATIALPASYNTITISGKVVWQDGNFKDDSSAFKDDDFHLLKFKVLEGNWITIAKENRK